MRKSTFLFSFARLPITAERAQQEVFRALPFKKAAGRTLMRAWICTLLIGMLMFAGGFAQAQTIDSITALRATGLKTDTIVEIHYEGTTTVQYNMSIHSFYGDMQGQPTGQEGVQKLRYSFESEDYDPPLYGEITGFNGFWFSNFEGQMPQDWNNLTTMQNVGWYYGGVVGVGVDSPVDWTNILDIANNTQICAGGTLAITDSLTGTVLATYAGIDENGQSILNINNEAYLQFLEDNKTYHSDTTYLGSQYSYSYIDGGLIRTEVENYSVITETIYNLRVKKSVGVEIPVPPTITTNSLPAATVGVPYTYTLTADGDAPITWTIFGSLPTGLSFNNTTGEIYGTPTTSSEVPISIAVQATNDAGSTPQKSLILIINAAPAPTATPLTISAWCPAGDGKFANASNDNTISFQGTWPGENYIAGSYGLVPEGTALTYDALNSSAFIYLGSEYDKPGYGTGTNKYFNNVDFTALDEEVSPVAPGQYRIVVFAQEGENDEEVFYSDATVTVVDGDGYTYNLSATTVEVTSGGTVGVVGGTTLTLHIDLGVSVPVSILPSDVLYFGIFGETGSGADFSNATITSPAGLSISPFNPSNIRRSAPYTLSGSVVDIVISGVTALIAGELDAHIKFQREVPNENEVWLGHWNGTVTFTEAPTTVTQSIALNSGVNWISTNVTSTDPTLLNQVKSSLSTVGQQIKASGNKTLMKSGAAWIGTITSLSEKEMYQVTVKASHNLEITGEPVNPANTPIALVANGWSWVGYTPSAAMSVQAALTNANAQANDQIKSQTGYAQYTGSGWAGEGLDDMEPGKGYMYLSNAAAKTFYYPNGDNSVVVVGRSAKATVERRWTVDRHRFADNMTVTAIVLDHETEMHSDLVEIAAFVDGECRGSALLQYVEGTDKPYMGFLMISGNAGERLTFKVYDHGRQAEYNASGPVNTFSSNAVYGNPLHPSTVTFGSPTGIERISGALRIYPNPVKDVLYIEHGQTKIDRLEIFDISGTRHAGKVDFTEQSLGLSQLTAGLYLLKITLNGETSVHKFIKQ